MKRPGPPPVSEAQAKEAIAALERANGNIAVAARSLGIGRSALTNRLHRGKSLYGVQPSAINRPISDELATNDSDIYELRAQLRALRSDTLTDEYVKRKIVGLAEELATVEPPAWTLKSPPKGSRLPGVPTALWSDWHWGEVVDPRQIGGVNQYDLAIAHRRAKALTAKTIYLLREHIVRPEYPGIVLALGGDMLSGDIHDELTITNETPMMPALIDLYGVLCAAISALADAFGHVFLPCVTGNHGRNTRKPRAKDRAYTNFDWLLYQFLAKRFADDPRMQFAIADGPDAYYRIYGHRFCLTHGDQFRGGDGIIGHYGPVLRGTKKKFFRDANVDKEFDCLLHGHFHTYFPTPRVIGNGSLKGYDEYANIENFAYEPPIQALFLTHYEHGVTQHLPVYLEPHAGRQQAKEWAAVAA